MNEQNNTPSPTLEALIKRFTDEYVQAPAYRKVALGILISTLWERNHIGYARLEIKRKLKNTNFLAVQDVYREFLRLTEGQRLPEEQDEQ